jgi:hypothetical protein
MHSKLEYMRLEPDCMGGVVKSQTNHSVELGGEK